MNVKIRDIMVLMESWGDLHSNKALTMVDRDIRNWWKGNDIINVIGVQLRDDIIELMKEDEHQSPLELVSGVRSHIKYSERLKKSVVIITFSEYPHYENYTRGYNMDTIDSQLREVSKKLNEHISKYDRYVSMLRDEINEKVLDDYGIELGEGKCRVYCNDYVFTNLQFMFVLSDNIMGESKKHAIRMIRERLRGKLNHVVSMLNAYIPDANTGSISVKMGVDGPKLELLIFSSKPIEWRDISHEGKEAASVRSDIDYYDINNSYDLVGRLVDAVLKKGGIEDFIDFSKKIKHGYRYVKTNHLFTIPLDFEKFSENGVL